MDKTLIDIAAKALAIDAVFLRASAIRCREDFQPQFIEGHLSLVPQYRGGPTGRFHIFTSSHEETGETNMVAVFYFGVGVRLVDAESLAATETGEALPEDASYLEIESEFCAQYRIAGTTDDHELQTVLEEFGRYNVGYHVWPYWREYLQGTCARMGIPVIPLPMYQIPQS
jgi:hypothetical protein